MARSTPSPTDEFAAYEATGAVPAAGDDPTDAPTRPALVITTFVPPTTTIAIDGTIYALRTLAEYSVGKQTALINDRNQQLQLRAIEEAGGDLDAEQAALHRFYLERIVRRACPDLPAARLQRQDDADGGDPLLSDEQLEAIATLFFELSADQRNAAPASRRT